MANTFHIITVIGFILFPTIQCLSFSLQYITMDGDSLSCDDLVRLAKGELQIKVCKALEFQQPNINFMT